MTRRVILTFGVVVAQALLSFAYQNEPSGFRGIAWGTKRGQVKEPMVFIEDDGGVGFYERKGDSLQLGTVPLTRVRYGFYGDAFYVAQVFFAGDTSAASIKDHLWKEYGAGQPGKSMEAGAQIFGWGGTTTMILYKYFPGTKEGRVIFTSTAMLQERRAKG